jgi:mannose-6-phosphate isomerase-like protein (cupin superfamily)
MEPIILRSGEGEMIGGGPAAAVVKATAESTGGGFTMSDSTIAPGFPGPPAHSHQQITDTFYVLEGTLTVRLGNDFVDAPVGTYVCIPPGNVHTFSNRGNGQVRFLNINSPAGWENYLRDVAGLMEAGPPTTEDWRRVMEKYDFIPAD